MSIFKKILGLAENPPEREKIPRAPRIRLQNIHHLVLTSPRWNDQFIKVVNISTTGVGAEPTGKPDDLEEGSTFPAMLTLNQKTFPVLLKLAHLTTELLGLSFQGELSQLQKAVFDYFVAEISGMEVNEVNAKLLKPDTRGDARWFFGSNNSEIYYTLKENQLTYFHVTLLGNYIEAYADKPPRFGYVITQEGENKIKPDQSSLIRFTEEISESTVDLFIKFVKHIETLRHDTRSLILSVLEEIKADQVSKNLTV